MVRESGCTTATIQVCNTGAGHGLGIWLEGLTASEVSRLHAIIARWRGCAAAASCSRGAGRSPDSVCGSSEVPLVSIGPSGLGGPYQTEF